MTLIKTQSIGSDGQPLRKTVRRLRWFKTSFAEQVEDVEREKGLAFAINEQKQAAAFVDWLRAFEAQKPQSGTGQTDSRRDFVGFAAGLMLRSLLKHDPLEVINQPNTTDSNDPAYFWPQGYVYVSYCLTVRAAVLEQDFHEELHLAPSIGDLKTWQSFKENVVDDPSIGIAFLDLFAGDHPQWNMPDLFRSKDVKLIASHLMQLKDQEN